MSAERLEDRREVGPLDRMLVGKSVDRLDQMRACLMAWEWALCIDKESCVRVHETFEALLYFKRKKRDFSRWITYWWKKSWPQRWSSHILLRQNCRLLTLRLHPYQRLPRNVTEEQHKIKLFFSSQDMQCSAVDIKEGAVKEWGVWTVGSDSTCSRPPERVLSRRLPVNPTCRTKWIRLIMLGASISFQETRRIKSRSNDPFITMPFTHLHFLTRNSTNLGSWHKCRGRSLRHNWILLLHPRQPHLFWVLWCGCWPHRQICTTTKWDR